MTLINTEIKDGETYKYISDIYQGYKIYILNNLDDPCFYLHEILKLVGITHNNAPTKYKAKLLEADDNFILSEKTMKMYGIRPLDSLGRISYNINIITLDAVVYLFSNMGGAIYRKYAKPYFIALRQVNKKEVSENEIKLTVENEQLRQDHIRMEQLAQERHEKDQILIDKYKQEMLEQNKEYDEMITEHIDQNFEVISKIDKLETENRDLQRQINEYKNNTSVKSARLQKMEIRASLRSTRKIKYLHYLQINSVNGVYLPDILGDENICMSNISDFMYRVIEYGIPQNIDFAGYKYDEDLNEYIKTHEYGDDRPLITRGTIWYMSYNIVPPNNIVLKFDKIPGTDIVPKPHMKLDYYASEKIYGLQWKYAGKIVASYKPQPLLSLESTPSAEGFYRGSFLISKDDYINSYIDFNLDAFNM